MQALGVLDSDLSVYCGRWWGVGLQDDGTEFVRGNDTMDSLGREDVGTDENPDAHRYPGSDCKLGRRLLHY